MSKRPDEQAKVASTAQVTLTLTLSPGLRTDEFTAFESRARKSGESVADRVARLMLEDLEKEEDPEKAA